MVILIGTALQKTETRTLTEQPLRFLCFGMGAIGTYIGGSLAAAGYPVSFLERPEAKKALQGRSLFVDTPSGTKRVEN